jgi:hypothetical protein
VNTPKKEVATGEKPESSGKKHEDKTSSKEIKICGDKHNEKKEDSTGSIKSHKKKKKMKMVVYYETDSSAPSTSDAESTSSRRQERKKYSEIPLRNPRISKHALLLFVPLGKPPYFNGEDYSIWSNKMRHHLTSLHKAFGLLLSLKPRHHRWVTRTMILMRLPKLGTSTPKPPPYSSLPCVGGTTRCKG